MNFTAQLGYGLSVIGEGLDKRGWLAVLQRCSVIRKRKFGKPDIKRNVAQQCAKTRGTTELLLWFLVIRKRVDNLSNTLPTHWVARHKKRKEEI